VDLKTPGISKSVIEKVGVRGMSLCQVDFRDVVVPGEDVLDGSARLNSGWDQLVTVMESEHLETAACGLGIAQGVYDYAANYAKERVQFGKPIVKFEAVLHMLVDMAVSIHISRLLAYRAGWLADRGKSCLLEAVMARAHAAETARRAGMQSMQVLGGYGYTMEYDVQRYVRDSLVLLGGGRPVEVLKNSMGALLDLS
jgi:alkylation response protein AidB-like acyl-CoA dehydrogenase